MNDETSEVTAAKLPPYRLPPGTPKWILILCCVVSGVIVPSFLAFSPQLSEVIQGATEARRAQAENEKTALGTVLELVNTNIRQIYILSEALSREQEEKKELAKRVTDLERAVQTHNNALKDCEAKLKLCH